MQTLIARRPPKPVTLDHPCAPCIVVWLIAAPVGACGMLRLLWWLLA